MNYLINQLKMINQRPIKKLFQIQVKIFEQYSESFDHFRGKSWEQEDLQYDAMQRAKELKS